MLSFSHVNFTACNYFIGGNFLPHICAVSGMICCTYIKIAIELILGGIFVLRQVHVLSSGAGSSDSDYFTE